MIPLRILIDEWKKEKEKMNDSDWTTYSLDTANNPHYNDWLPEQLETIVNLVEVSKLLMIHGRVELLPTVLEHMFEVCQQITLENCVEEKPTLGLVTCYYPDCNKKAGESGFCEYHYERL